MLASSMAGCSKASNNKGDNSGTKTETNAEPTKFSMSMRSLALKYVDNAKDLNTDKWKLELEKRTNTKIDLKVIPQTNYVGSMNMMFASGDIPDVVQASSLDDPALANAVQEGIFMPLDDLLKKAAPNMMKLVPKIAWEDTTYDDGKIYGMPEYLSSTTRRATYIRKDLLDKYGLKVPVTLDDFVNVMKVFKQNGVKYPYVGREKWMYTDLFFGAFNALPTTYLLNDKKEVVPAYVQPQMKDALAFHKMLNDQGLIDQQSLLNKQVDWEKKCLSGDVGIFSRNVKDFTLMQTKLKAAVPTAQLMMIAGPTGPDGKHGMAKASPTMRCYMINKKYARPENIIKFFDWMATDEAAEFFSFGIEGQDYTKKDGKIEFTYPTDISKLDEVNYRSEWLWGVRDSAYNKRLLPYQDGGKEILNFFEKIAPTDGRVWINPKQMDSTKKYPDLDVAENQQALWQKFAAQVFYGEVSVDKFDDFVADYYKRGGNEIVKEATERYNKGTGKLNQ